MNTTELTIDRPLNRFTNLGKAVTLGNDAWQAVDSAGLLNIGVERAEDGTLMDENGHSFINMCSCSYLGLDRHPKIIDRAVASLRAAGTLNLSTARLRIHLRQIDEVEEALSDMFEAKVFTTISCAAGSAGILPVLASGALSGGEKPAMVFDQNCHFSMNLIKPICGDETNVFTCKNNDIDFIEDLCRTHRTVAYVSDAAYSMGGFTPMAELNRLQEKYGLYLYLDDSHSLSVYGKRGVGFARSATDLVHDRTIISASLGKAFGACGGIVITGRTIDAPLVERFGGPMAWSQCLNPAGVGAVMASIEIHLSQELNDRQQALRENILLMDKLVPSSNVGSESPIRVIPMPSAEKAVEVSRKMYQRGFYTSAIFFPIVKRGTAGLRVMARADLSRDDMTRFAEALDDAML